VGNQAGFGPQGVRGWERGIDEAGCVLFTEPCLCHTVVKARRACLLAGWYTQVTTPVAIMTSDAKGNHSRITGLMESLQWFGRGRDSFRLFR
jgi:hypothetical protein